MYKVHFLLVSDGDPFRYQGDEALEAVRYAFPNAIGYVQSRALVEQVGGDNPPYAGSMELWFPESGHALEATAAAGTDMLASHATNKSSLVGMERVVMRLPSHFTGQSIKGIFPFRRKKDMNPIAFQHHWWHNHGPIAALTEGGLCYVQTHRLLQSYVTEDSAIDGITEIHWSDTRSAEQAMQSRQMREDQGNDAQNFVDQGSVELFLAEEEIIIAP